MRLTIMDYDERIDWGKPQWVMSTFGKKIILTNGKHTEDTFEGTALPCAEYPNGDISMGWDKRFFIPIKGVISLKISN